MPKLNIGELNELFQKAESVDKEVFAEQRSNILLVAGDHYQKKADRYFSQIRDNRDLSDNQKLRLTKNHVHKVHRRYVQNILNFASNVSVAPQRDTEMQDQKAAELNQSVWKDAKNRYRLKEKIRSWASDYVEMGEVAIKLFWDPDKGPIVGYNQKLNDEGEPLFDLMGQPMPDEENPEFQGDFVFERLFAFNLLRDPVAKSMEDSEFIIVRKMMTIKVLKKRYKDDPAKLRMISSDKGSDFIIFDSAKGGYDRATEQTMLREYYYRPSRAYPKGYYFITTQAGILEEGELPFGKFPIVWQGFDKHPTTPRARSIIKQARPYQAEINRASSAMAMHQITIGDDKIIYQAGTKLAPGALLPGVRGITFQGAPPQVLQGRDGAQFLNYIGANITEMYEVLDLQEIETEKGQQFDPFSLLYRSANQRQRFSFYSEQFEQFLMDVCELFLDLARNYYPDEMLIPAVSRQEIVNIEEFRSTEPLHYKIVVEAQDETLETKFGRQLTMQQILQYSGKQLSREDVGKIVKAMPMANVNEAFDDLTIESDNAKNDMLMLERGGFPEPDPNDDHVYMIKRLTNRMKQPDFQFLDPQIQQAYNQKKQMHQQLDMQRQQQLKQAQSEYIPADGPMIACDMYLENKEDPTKAPKRARIPQRALDWLVKQLEAQGATLEQLEGMEAGNLNNMMQMLKQQGAPAGPPMPPQQQMGPASPY